MCAVMSIIGMISPIMRNIQRAFITGLCIRREFPCERGREFLTESSLGDLIIPGSVLDRGSTSEVISATREIIESVGRKRLILGADCTIPRSVSLDRLELIRRVAAES